MTKIKMFTSEHAFVFEKNFEEWMESFKGKKPPVIQDIQMKKGFFDEMWMVVVYEDDVVDDPWAWPNGR